MSDSLREKVFYILEDSDFNDLPYEERKRIGKYLAEQQILTLFQVINKDKANTTETWRKKTTAWLKNCVDSFYHEYRCPSDRKTENSLGKPNNCEDEQMETQTETQNSNLTFEKVMEEIQTQVIEFPDTHQKFTFARKIEMDGDSIKIGDWEYKGAKKKGVDDD